MNALPLPCPFCGQQPTHNTTNWRPELKIKTHHFLRCRNKRCPVDVKAFGYSLKEVIGAWNTRTNYKP